MQENSSGHINHADLEEHIREFGGSRYRLRDIRRIGDGGAQKAVYKLNCTGGPDLMLFVWDLSANYFEQDWREAGVTEESYGALQFERNTHLLSGMGVRVPAIRYISRERNRYPFDYAIVEYIHGPNLMIYEEGDTAVRDRIYEELAGMLGKMHASRSAVWGEAAEGRMNRETAAAAPCHSGIYDNALRELAFTVARIDHADWEEKEIRLHLDRLLANIRPRGQYGFIHGELGPDHVLVNERLEPYLIDIEGSEYFDIEHEHSFLQFRFGALYDRYLRRDDLDPDRMLFYKFHHHLSCTAGGLKLLERGFPNRKLAGEIYEHNRQSVLDMLKSGR
ncbi:phosphotransferase family protein [Paenibacillus nasutitermitis]|uniref:Aminoglycoside phosphotransferase n=1 Tax=Paenibacillus nasutitermitis TaxID=1652958 RepID=A0A917E0W5_9BACL|nr:phosphotransferase [Paenibacillus nasutitermitis]GGD86339.1 aminoglycoside phosphotransferase [Paenibacillus nasutitermitis]